MKFKQSKLWMAVGASLLTLALVACGDKGDKDSPKGTADNPPESSQSSQPVVYNSVYTIDPDTMDYIKANRAGTSDLTTNLIDGLMENDQYGNLVPSMAESWTVSPDGLVYTYKLRKNASWYTSSGEEYAKVTAHDFVTGLKHAADSKSDSLYVVQKSIKGLDDYVNGRTTDFSTVGVKALDDYTVQYTLVKPESYWNSKTTYDILFPVNEEFLKSEGDNFAKVGDPDSLLYNGPFLLKSLTIKSSIELEKNPQYWDAKNVHIDDVKLTYFDGQDQDSLFNNFAAGAYTVASLYPNAPSYKTAERDYANNIVYGPQDSSTYVLFFNMNRTKMDLSNKTKAQQADTTKALRNKDFRQAITFAFDRAAYNAQSAGEEAKDKSLRNTFVPPEFVQINGKDFIEEVKKDLASYSDIWSDVNFSNAQDGLHNPQKAKLAFEKAKKTLSKQGVKFPIQLDFVVDQTSTSAVQQANSIKESIESCLGKENVVINVVQTTKDEDLAATYYAQSPSQNDYDITISGWIPDYQDPKTFLDTLGTTKDAALSVRLGVDVNKPDTKFIHEIGLDAYQKMLDQADAIRNDTNARYEAYAKAQAWLIDSAIVIPTTSSGGRPFVTRAIPFSGPYAWVGTKGGSFKYLQLGTEPVTVEAYAQAQANWEKVRKESNAKAAADLPNHVEK